jgi:hypothetical protein
MRSALYGSIFIMRTFWQKRIHYPPSVWWDCSKLLGG